jgi:signal transduction histidine kinase
MVGRYSGPFVVLGSLIAIACVAGIWYVNHLQGDLARAVQDDAVGLERAIELQVQLRHLRVHSLVLVADHTAARQAVVDADLARVDAALAGLRGVATTAEDRALVDVIERDYSDYRVRLVGDLSVTDSATRVDLARWSDGHHMADLLVPCQQFAERRRDRMNAGLKRTEERAAWAGRGVLVLGGAAVLAGLLTGFATARAVSRREAGLFVRVRAVQAHLDQDIGTMTVDRTGRAGDLDEQLDLIVGRVREVCERLQEKERNLHRAEQLAAVGQLAAGVAHEVRNPLTGVKLLLQAAARPQSPTPLTADRLDLLLKEVGRIERTVQGLVDFAKMPPADRRSHDLRELAAEAVEVERPRADAKAVGLRAEVAGIPALVRVDRDQVRSLLANLLSNAIDATPPGGYVVIRVGPEQNGHVALEVIDSGPGIDPTVSGRLFTPFVTTKSTGTGLGLTLAERIARDHGGTLTAGNRHGGGASFRLVLPALEESDVQIADRG